MSVTITSEHILYWLAVLYWDDEPSALRFDARDVRLAIAMTDGTI